MTRRGWRPGRAALSHAVLGSALWLGLLGTAPAGATTAPPLTLAQQVGKAEVIVRARVGAAVNVKDGEITYLAYPLTLLETIAGDAASLPQNEGQPALFFLQGVNDLPEVRAGQEVIALLYARKLDSPVVGFNQGWYVITNGQVTAGDKASPITTPDQLRQAIRAAREAK
ncbi:hypothetical protein [Deinococcus aerophilus]|uniref:Uncharacterized protein n=1 Tax=Deinococcus aerophilus TaxID=522488 RepID=A0ABQ2GYY3_9DEIO|nr:hypothetical protein [Deinococcus aerophilus]GGM20513.1 hypothetical protein GCM10010841_30620 [Deinococcus aerophilus]